MSRHRRRYDWPPTHQALALIAATTIGAVLAIAAMAYWPLVMGLSR